MKIAPRKIIAAILLGFAAVGIGALGYFMAQEGQISPKIFSGAMLGSGGVVTPEFDPLLSGRACSSGGSNILAVAPEGERFHWSVSPPANVLSVEGSGNPPSSDIPNGPNEIRFTAPDPEDLNFAISYVVDVELFDALPGTSGDSFEISLSPSCVEGLEFITPSGIVLPEDGEIELTGIRAQLTNGDTVLYDATEIPSLGINFVAEPAGQVQFIGNRIIVPFEHQETSIHMELRGSALSPVTLDRNNEVVGDSGVYALDSDEADPDSVFVFADDAGEPGDLLEEGTDYAFADVTHDPDGTDVDTVEWIGAGAAPASLFIAYSYRDSEEVLISSNSLTIAAPRCELLNANVYQGQGQGFYFPEEGSTPSSGSSSAPFDFGGADPVDSILISNPPSNTLPFGAGLFELRFNFADGLAQRAVLANQSGTNYEISVRRDAEASDTAANFAYAMNTVSDGHLPFIAYVDPANDEQVILYSVELGGHTNNYACSVNGDAVDTCFIGGSTGTTADGDGLVDVDPPRPLDPILNQGETRVVYSRGGVNNLTWRSSDSHIFSVASLSEAVDEEDLLGNDNVILNAGALTMGDFNLPTANITNVSNCANTMDADGDEILQSCLITIQAPVILNADPAGYSITIIPPAGDAIPGTVQGTSASGQLTGNLDVNHLAGGIITATGLLSLPVGGDAIGSLEANVTMLVSIAPFETSTAISSGWTITSVTGTLSKVELIPTDRTPGGGTVAVTNFAVLTAKRPGSATLFVSDVLGCTAPLDIDVLGEQLFIDFASPNQAEFIEQGNSVQLRAWTGFRGSMDAAHDVTNAAGTTWEVDADDTDVLSVTSTGRVTALKPGIGSVYARYTTNVPETGELRSEGSLTIRVDNIEGLTISLNRESLALLPEADRDNAYRSVLLLVNKPEAAGRSVTVGSATINVELPAGTYTSRLEQIDAITNNLSTGLAAVPGVAVTSNADYPGVLTLESATDDPLVISTTAAPDVITILPVLSSSFELPRNETYRMVAVAEYASGRTRFLPANYVNWVSTPVNALNSAALETGLIRMGDARGTAVVHAEFDNQVATSPVESNELTVTIEEGPVVEYLRRVGTGVINKGSQIELQLRVSDIDGVSDIQNIEASLVRSTGTTYAAIDADPAAIWFTAIPLLDAVEEEPDVPATDMDAGTADPDGTEMGDELQTEPVSPLFHTYSIPVQIPTHAALFDGNYWMVVSITDVAGHVTHALLALRVGAIASGDVNGDGRINMIDVILSFQIVNGTLTPTTEQLQAANADGRGSVSMIDVILLFMRVNS